MGKITVTELVQTISALRRFEYSPKTGKPSLKALRKRLKSDVSPRQRDEAWRMFQDQRSAA